MFFGSRQPKQKADEVEVVGVDGPLVVVQPDVIQPGGGVAGSHERAEGAFGEFVLPRHFQILQVGGGGDEILERVDVGLQAEAYGDLPRVPLDEVLEELGVGHGHDRECER